MKKLIALSGIIPLVVFGGAFAAPAPKVVICHFTSSDTNPWNRIEVSENAIGGHFDNPGSPKAGHEDDLLLPAGSECPVIDEEEPVEEPVEPEEPEEELPIDDEDTEEPEPQDTTVPVQEDFQPVTSGK